MDVVIQRGKKVKLEELPIFSIALDGFVAGPQVDPKTNRFSFDHHEGCLRYCTSSACMQAWTAVLLGLDPTGYTIYANDVDSDVCVAVWCLRNPDRCQDPLVKKLVDAVGLGDMHGGAFPFPNNGMAKTVEWISAPETDSRRNNDYNKLSDAGLYSVLEAVLHRIDMYADGEASIEVAKQPKHGEYKILRNENNWVLIESQDPHVFGAVYHAGFDRIVLSRPQDDGSLAITFAKRSDFVDKFCVPRIIEEINKLEPGAGGGSTMAGVVRNPDGSRSRLPLSTIIEIVDKIALES
jgi:hypothetical protein